MNHAIEVRQLNKFFSGVHAVNDLSLAIRKGNICGFLGPNGSGKTTTLRMLCGLLTPDSGSGHCLGCDIFTQNEAIKRQTGYMTQQFSLWVNLTIRENLELVARLQAVPELKNTVDSMLERMDLSQRQHQLAGNLSGGWKQRLALATSLLHKPALLLLDEPTAGVDPNARRQFWQILHRLADEGVTILVSTHYMDEAERCHQLAYIAWGKLLASGDVHSIITQQQLTTWQIRGANLSALEAQLENAPGVAYSALLGNVLHITGCDDVALAKTLRSLPSGYQTMPTETGLEDIFSHLLQQYQPEGER